MKQQQTYIGWNFDSLWVIEENVTYPHFQWENDCGSYNIPICLITVDSTSTKNLIVWEKPVAAGIDSFKIYRDIVGTYKHIGSVAYEDLSLFGDITPGVNPQITSYKYKISVVDTCGYENLLSDFHETMHVTASLGTPPPAINLVWDSYVGFPVSYYYILRDSTGLGNYEKIDSVSNTNFTYTDLGPPAGTVYYLIEAKHPTGCNATLVSAKSKNFNKTRSNYQNKTITGVPNPQGFGILAGLNVYPNPYTGKTQITYSLTERANVSLEVYNILGKKIQTIANKMQGQGTYNYTFSAKDIGFVSGIYVLKFRAGNNIIDRFLVELK